MEFVAKEKIQAIETLLQSHGYVLRYGDHPAYGAEVLAPFNQQTWLTLGGNYGESNYYLDRELAAKYELCLHIERIINNSGAPWESAEVRQIKKEENDRRVDRHFEFQAIVKELMDFCCHQQNRKTSSRPVMTESATILSAKAREYLLYKLGGYDPLIIEEHHPRCRYSNDICGLCYYLSYQDKSLAIRYGMEDDREQASFDTAYQDHAIKAIPLPAKEGE